METKKVATPKSFFAKERDQFYSDWQISFWRELFQNSVDAGASRISVSIRGAAARGSFAEAGDSSRKVTRIVFEDDGCGMDVETLDRVYFAIGQTTKGDDSSVGGYGRARLMTCFSQERYSILTTDRFVMGDGPDYVNYSLDEAERVLARAVSGLQGKQEDVDASGAALRADLERVKAARAAGGFKGCRVEIDCENEDKWNSPTPERMAERLKEYLSESQVPVTVLIEGRSPEEFYSESDKIQARRGPVRKRLSCVVNGETVEFANVHTSEGEKARHKGKVIVRVDGAAMYSRDARAAAQIIVEVDKGLSRTVLNSNRDGMKSPYSSALDAFIAELNVDRDSALEDLKGRDNWKVEGERGTITAVLPRPADIARKQADGEELEVGDQIAANASQYAGKLSTLERLNIRGLTEDDMEAVVMDARYGQGLLQEARYAPGFELAPDIDDFIRKISSWHQSYERSERVDFFIENASDALKEWVAHTIVARREKAIAEVREKNDHRIKGMNDIYVRVLSANEKTRAAIRRNDPRRWNVGTGKGRAARALLSAWTAACAVSVETLIRQRPALEGFEWTTGWVYSVPEEKHLGDGERRVSVEALFVQSDNVTRFLLNPVTDDGNLRYSVSDPKDRQRLLALSMHEVSHVIADWHDETFAGTMTDLMMEIDMVDANRRMKDAVRAVMVAYESGRATVQAMDGESGPRPAARLLALATRNEGPSEAEITHNADGTWNFEPEAHARETAFEDEDETDVPASAVGM